MSDYTKTIYYDLHALKLLSNYFGDTKFSVILPYSLIKDACVILHEIHQVMKHQGIIEERTKFMIMIEQIRNKVKTSHVDGMTNMRRIKGIIEEAIAEEVLQKLS